MENSGEERYECPICQADFDTNNGRAAHFGHHDSDEKRRVLLDGIDRLADELGRPPTIGEMKSIGEFGVGVYQNRFGSWNEALREAGHEPNLRRDIPTEELISEVDRLADELGRPPTYDEVKSIGEFSVSVYQNRFGSWNEALQEIGYELNMRWDIPIEELISEVDRLADELGRPPTQGEMKSIGEFCVGVYQNRFGSWREALRESGYEPHRKIGNNESNALCYGPNWSTTRTTVLERDDGHCRVCERTADNFYHSTLPVHHITPAREFGAHDPNVETDYDEMNDMDNLVTLCPSCHKTFEGKWQGCTPDEFARRAREFYSVDVDGVGATAVHAGSTHVEAD